MLFYKKFKKKVLNAKLVIMSIRTKELILVKFYLIVLVTKFAIVKSIDSMDNEADNQLVALDDEESNDLNNLNQGNFII